MTTLKSPNNKHTTHCSFLLRNFKNIRSNRPSLNKKMLHAHRPVFVESVKRNCKMCFCSVLVNDMIDTRRHGLRTLSLRPTATFLHTHANIISTASTRRYCRHRWKVAAKQGNQLLISVFEVSQSFRLLVYCSSAETAYYTSAMQLVFIGLWCFKSIWSVRRLGVNVM